MEETEISRGAVIYKLRHDGELNKYLTTSLLYIKYDVSIETVPKSIVSIPLVGCLAPLAWLTGSEIRIGEIDRQYISSLQEISSVLKKWYPTFPFTNNIISDEKEVVPSHWDERKYCLLFTGGVDSTASLLRNKERSLNPIMIRGTPDLRLHEGEFWRRLQNQIVPFLQSLNTELHIVETNAMDMINYHALNADFKKYLKHGWWENVSHSLILLSLCAPYTYSANIGRILIASSFTETTQIHWGSVPLIDEKIHWSGLKVIHDSFDIDRAQKIQTILVPFMRSRGRSIPLRVCTGKETARLQSGKLNCGRCEKCRRTILLLMIEGIDPSTCGFDMTLFSFERLKEDLKMGRIRILHEGLTDRLGIDWERAKEGIIRRRQSSYGLESSYPGLDDFLAWFSEWDLKPRMNRRIQLMEKLAPQESRRRNIIIAIRGR